MPALGPTRIIKKMEPQAPGALKLARHYGAALVCVRYRVDEERRRRYTTVELVVDEVPLEAAVRRDGGDAIVGVRIRYGEIELRTKAREAGAVWDRPAGLWRMPRREAEAIGLGSRIVAE